MSLRVPRWLYRTLWIAVAAFGALMLLGPVLVAIDAALDLGVMQAETNVRLTAATSGVIGFATLALALRRLLRPLKPKPHPAQAFD